MAFPTESPARVMNLDRTRCSPARLLGLAVASSTILAIAVLGMNAENHGGAVGLVDPGSKGPSAAVIAGDFPAVRLPAGVGHDGQQFYAIARQPMHPAAVARDLDRPRYRLQRILLPVLAWALHPTGGGAGLAIAVWLVACWAQSPWASAVLD